MKVYAKAEKIESFLKEEEAEERCFEIKDHIVLAGGEGIGRVTKAGCLLYTSPSPRDS